MNKAEIARQVRPITLEQAVDDMIKLRRKWISGQLKPLSNAGLKIIDYYTFEHRLSVRGKSNINFYDFLESWNEVRKKRYIKNLIAYYNNDESFSTIYKIYNLGVNCVHAFRPVLALQIYDRFCPTHVLDPCSGWGGRAVAASIYGARYTGFDTNVNLGKAYQMLSGTLNIDLNIGDSLKVDLEKIEKYDMVFTSPPYYNLERYEYMHTYMNDDEWDNEFYFPLFERLAKHLQPGGWIVLSINEKIFNRVFCVLFGPPHVKIPMTAYKRTISYVEWIYAWQK